MYFFFFFRYFRVFDPLFDYDLTNRSPILFLVDFWDFGVIVPLYSTCTFDTPTTYDTTI